MSKCAVIGNSFVCRYDKREREIETEKDFVASLPVLCDGTAEV